ncbi:oligopeptide/dipeptide ABC transporter ATP-binding protein [Streptomyces sp. NPDC048281]|uniref:oligopeptide/dipeptide ABC transporter ATP-binding protein n=1 Tax=Streptomyces sp. NPDC048281 TaxID=3154715 RepID=UPI00344A91AE
MSNVSAVRLGTRGLSLRLPLRGASPSAKVLTALAVLLVALALLAPVLATHRPDAVDMAQASRNPSAGHWLGTDALGRAEAEERLVPLLAEIGIPDGRRRLAQYPHQLSGGLLQRMMIASALVTAPRLLLADEPTTALDVTTQQDVMAILDEQRHERHLALLFVTHDLELAGAVCDRIAVMYAGTIVEQRPAAALHSGRRHPYTAGLLAARPGVGEPGTRLPVIPGRPAAAHESFEGCPFAPRCAFAEDRCRAERPPLRPDGDGDGAVACHRADELAGDLDRTREEA